MLFGVLGLVALAIVAFVDAKRAPIDPFPDDDFPVWKVENERDDK